MDMVQMVAGALLTLSTLGISGAVALLVSLNAKVAKQNGSVAAVIRDFSAHVQQNREDFRQVHDEIADVRAEQTEVATALAQKNGG